MDRCTICVKVVSIPDYHHTVPRSRGGEDSKQIPLCSSCHTILHAQALHILAKVRNPKKPTKVFWANEQEEQRARPWLKILVDSLYLPIKEGYEAQHPIHLSVDTKTYEQIKILQEDLGQSSIVKTILLSIKHTMSDRGLNVKNSEAGRPSMWFMRGPKS